MRKCRKHHPESFLPPRRPGALEWPLVWPWTRPAAREYLKTGADEDALRALVRAAGHGSFDPTPAEVFTRPTERAAQWTDLSDILLAIALILLPLDTWLKRQEWAAPAVPAVPSATMRPAA